MEDLLVCSNQQDHRSRLVLPWQPRLFDSLHRFKKPVRLHWKDLNSQNTYIRGTSVEDLV